MDSRTLSVGSFRLERHVSLAGAVSLALLLGQASAAFAAASYDTYANYNKDGYQAYDASDSAETFINFSSAPGGDYQSLLNTESFAGTSSYANPGNLKMGIRAFAQSMPQNNYFTDAYIYTDAANSFTVSPGSSGLAAGEVTTLRLRVRLDGTLHADARSWPGKSWAHADVDAGLSIHDYSIQIDTGEGTYSPALASFGASAGLEGTDIYKPYWGYSYSSPWSESWQIGSNIDPGDSYSLSGEDRQNSEGMYYPAGRLFDTGYRTVEFEAIVGHTLDVEAYLNSYVNANNDAYASAEFGNTFAFEVTPMTSGVEVSWAIVPEPSCLALLALGALPLLRRRAL